MSSSYGYQVSQAAQLRPMVRDLHVGRRLAGAHQFNRCAADGSAGHVRLEEARLGVGAHLRKATSFVVCHTDQRDALGVVGNTAGAGQGQAPSGDRQRRWAPAPRQQEGESEAVTARGTWTLHGSLLWAAAL